MMRELLQNFTSFQKSTLIRMLALPLRLKIAIVMLADACFCVLSVHLAFALRLSNSGSWTDNAYWAPWPASLICCAVAIAVFYQQGLYKAVFRYSSQLAVITVLRVFTLYALFISLVIGLLPLSGVPRTVGLIQAFVFFPFFMASRLLINRVYESLKDRSNNDRPMRSVLIYGVENLGQQLCRMLEQSKAVEVIGFVTSDRHLLGRLIDGKMVFAPSDIADLVVARGVSEVILADTSLAFSERSRIIDSLRLLPVAVRALPKNKRWSANSILLSTVTDLNVNDLLGRRPVEPDVAMIKEKVAGKVVMISGAGGSIGGELASQILTYEPSCLVLLDISEYNLYRITLNLEEALEKLSSRNVELVPLLGSVLDVARLDEIIGHWKPDLVYHAAAYKHVPIVENNVVEGVRNNVLGTVNVLNQALKHNTKDFVLISTDKAVKPTNIMGASKRLAELWVQLQGAEQQKRDSGCNCAVVRFGNVLESSGSVIPRFREQIQSGGPITLTHRDVTRYFMTLAEAAQLVMQASCLGEGNDMFLLDMGEPVKVLDLARRMVELSGLTIADDEHLSGDIAIVTTGLRPGEKLHEDLMLSQGVAETNHPRIHRILDPKIDDLMLVSGIEKLSRSIESRNQLEVIRTLADLIPEYRPIQEVDHLS